MFSNTVLIEASTCSMPKRAPRVSPVVAGVVEKTVRALKSIQDRSPRVFVLEGMIVLNISKQALRFVC